MKGNRYVVGISEKVTETMLNIYTDLIKKIIFFFIRDSYLFYLYDSILSFGFNSSTTVLQEDGFGIK